MAVRYLPGAGPRAASASRSSEPPGRGGGDPPGPARGEPIRSFTFSPRRRLRKPPEFDNVYRRGRRIHQKLFQAVVLPNEQGFARLGLSIAARAVGNAVSRNRIRRVIREVFRHRADLPAVDIVISARNQARSADNADLRADLERLLTAVCERCAPSPPSS